MITLVVRYRVKKNMMEKAKGAIREFVTRVKDREPETLVYESYQLGKDDQEFVHVMKFANEEAEELHRESDYCKKFVEDLYPLCERKPEFEKLIGFY